MRVLLVTHETSRSGAPRVALLTARALRDAGHDVQVVARADGPIRSELAATVPTSLEVLPRVRRRLWGVPGLRGAAWLLDSLLALVTVARRRPDLVGVSSTAAAVYLRPARLRRRRPLLPVHESGPLAGRFLARARVARDLAGVELVACSASVRRALHELSGRSEEDITLVPSVPDEQHVRALALRPPGEPYRPDGVVVGCCGTVEQRKGVTEWVEVARRVRAALPDRDLRFVWVGDVDPNAPEASAAGVEFLGPSDNPYAHMRRFDVATLPSRDDPFPLVVLESMAVGTPVVAFDVGSVALQVDGTGVVVPAGDVAAFASAVERLVRDDGERARLGSAASARVDTCYSLRAFSEQVVAVAAGGGQSATAATPDPSSSSAPR